MFSGLFETNMEAPANNTFVSRMIGIVRVPETNSLHRESRLEQLEVCAELASLTLYASKDLETNVQLIKNVTWTKSVEKWVFMRFQTSDFFPVANMSHK